MLLGILAVNLDLPLCVFLLEASETNDSGFRRRDRPGPPAVARDPVLDDGLVPRSRLRVESPLVGRGIVAGKTNSGEMQFVAASWRLPPGERRLGTTRSCAARPEVAPRLRGNVRFAAGYFLPLARKPGTLPDSTVCQNFDDTCL